MPDQNDQITQLQQNQTMLMTSLPFIKDELKDIKSNLETLENKFDERLEIISVNISATYGEFQKKYVRKEEFAPIKAVVYGMAGMILAGFLSGVLVLVLKS